MLTIILSLVIVALVARGLVLEYANGYYQSLLFKHDIVPAINSLSFITLLIMVIMRIPVKDTDPNYEPEESKCEEEQP